MLQKEEQVQNLNLQMPKTPQIVKINTNIKLVEDVVTLGPMAQATLVNLKTQFTLNLL
jgi:hypothetical protein